MSVCGESMKRCWYDKTWWETLLEIMNSWIALCTFRLFGSHQGIRLKYKIPIIHTFHRNLNFFFSPCSRLVNGSLSPFSNLKRGLPPCSHVVECSLSHCSHLAKECLLPCSHVVNCSFSPCSHVRQGCLKDVSMKPWS